MVISGHGHIVLVNAELERVFGYSRTELVGQHYGVILPTDGSAPPAHQLGRNLALTGRHRDGAALPVEVRKSRLASGPDAEIAVSLREISGRQGAGAGNGSGTHSDTDTDTDTELRTTMSLLRATLDSTADGILVVSQEGRIEGSNENFATLWGIPADLMESRDNDRLMAFVLDQLVDPSGFAATVHDLFDDPHAESFDVLSFRDGRTIERYSRPQRLATQVVGRVWSFRDVTLRQRAEDQARDALAELAEQAAHHRMLASRDPLTGLANREMFHERLDGALAARRAGDVHVLLVDLDDFKEVNDIFGHQSGDDLLVEIGRRLTRCVSPGDTVARLGGDEFVILLTGDHDPGAAAGRIVAALNLPAYFDDVEIRVSVSLGHASTADGSHHGVELMRRADIALYAAKAAGKNRHESFHPDMMSALLSRTDLEAGLRRAVQRQEILVHFQPIMSPETASVSQVEVLARWQRPTGLVAPMDFIPAAERNGSIVGLGEEILRQACAQLRDWLSACETRTIAVNASAVQIREEHFATRALAILAGHSIRPAQVVIEVTESVFMVPGTHVVDQLTLLRQHGVRIAIDDFGTGYSSLGRLQDLPVDAIKVDKSFVDKIVTGDENLPILNSMIALAQNLGLHVTAEGVETDAQAAQLVRLGCDALQGYLFSRPQPASGLPEAEQRSTVLMQGVLDRAA
jgi:diguanylate cyclase (GGDEF)-like protein/PAS domain S-box-containing protein